MNNEIYNLFIAHSNIITIKISDTKICSHANNIVLHHEFKVNKGRRGRDRMVVGFTTAYPIGAYYH